MEPKNRKYRGAYVIQEVECPTLAQVMISWFGSLSPMSGSARTVRSSVGIFLSLPLCLSLSLPSSLSFSSPLKINE